MEPPRGWLPTISTEQGLKWCIPHLLKSMDLGSNQAVGGWGCDQVYGKDGLVPGLARLPWLLCTACLDYICLWMPVTMDPGHQAQDSHGSSLRPIAVQPLALGSSPALALVTPPVQPSSAAGVLVASQLQLKALSRGNVPHFLSSCGLRATQREQVPPRSWEVRAGGTATSLDIPENLASGVRGGGG